MPEATARADDPALGDPSNPSETPTIPVEAPTEIDPAPVADTAEVDPDSPAAKSVPWEPPEPSDTELDWVKLNSGEWLKGEFHRMRDGDVEFESDELDLLTISFSDIAEFRSPRPHIYRFEGRKIFKGSATMRDGIIRIKTLPDGDLVEHPRGKLVTVVAGDGSELDYWAIRVSAGVSARSGNTDQTDISGSGSLRRGTALTRWISTYNGAFASVSGGTTENNHRVRSTFDVFLTRRLFVTAPYFEYFTDRFQNIDLRITPGALVGYELLDLPWLSWEALGGPAYQRTIFNEVFGDDDRKANDFAMIAGTELNFDFPRDIEFDSLYQVQVIATDMDKTSHHWQNTLSFELWGPLDFDITFILDRIEEPEPDSSGSRPDSNDYRLSVGLGLEWP